MRGVPKWFNTKEDILNSMQVSAEATKMVLQDMLDARMQWFPDSEVVEKGEDTKTVKFVQDTDMETNESRWIRYELREDENAWMFRINLTVEEINKLLEA